MGSLHCSLLTDKYLSDNVCTEQCLIKKNHSFYYRSRQAKLQRHFKKSAVAGFNSFPVTYLAVSLTAIWESGMSLPQHTQLWRGAAETTCDGELIPKPMLSGTAHLSKILLFLYDIKYLSLEFPIYTLQPFCCAGPSLLPCRSQQNMELMWDCLCATHWREYSLSKYLIQSRFEIQPIGKHWNCSFPALKRGCAAPKSPQTKCLQKYFSTNMKLLLGSWSSNCLFFFWTEREEI